MFVSDTMTKKKTIFKKKLPVGIVDPNGWMPKAVVATKKPVK